MSTVLLLSTADTDLLAARASGSRLPHRQPDPRRRRGGTARAAGRRRPGRGAAAGRQARLGGGAGRAEGVRRPHGAARRGERAGRGADGRVERPGGRGGRGAALSRGGRPGEPRRAGALPVGHRAADRRGLRTAAQDAGVRRARLTGRAAGTPDRRRALLPRPRTQRQHRVRGHPVRRDRGTRRQRASRVLRFPARRRPGAVRAAGPGGRAGRHRARGRMAATPRRRRRAARRRPGTSARSPS